ncbi:MAG TPA: alpha/beta hydrolase [bacterium]|nr:alpha/beta hydrolase [bacterium]
MQLEGQHVYVHDGGHAPRPGQPWVVLVHGAGGTHVLWQQQSRALAHHGCNVLVPDLPGHGASADLPGLASVEDYAAWLARLLRALQVPAAHVVGHSLGACIAVSLAAAEPALVQSLVLVGAALEMRVNPDLLRDCLENTPQAVAFITAYGHGRAMQVGGAPVPGTWVLGADRTLVAGSSGAVLRRDFAASAAWQGGPACAAVRCPTLVLTGGADRMTPPKAGRQLAAAIRGAVLEEAPGSGHFLPAEAPSWLRERLSAWLAKPARAGAA